MKNIKPYVISFAVTFAAAAAGAVVTYTGMDRFSQLVQPPLSPPAFLFPVVWTILYALMAYGAAKVYEQEGTLYNKALFSYAVQLILNLGWSVIFFGLGQYLAAFIWLLLLWAAVIVMILLFYKADKTAGLIQIPYLLWLTFAAYLNLGIYLLNG